MGRGVRIDAANGCERAREAKRVGAEASRVVLNQSRQFGEGRQRVRFVKGLADRSASRGNEQATARDAAARRSMFVSRR
ncbi:hypothetical protein AQ876_20650 [Burkholderia pseudomallei]|nr:hypothetical protein AQ876_20650 [Burkholderia pseudomallei]